MCKLGQNFSTTEVHRGTGTVILEKRSAVVTMTVLVMSFEWLCRTAQNMIGAGSSFRHARYSIDL